MTTKQKQTYAQNALTEALLRLLKETDIHNITVSQLAKEAQVTRVTFYRNYRNLEDVLQAHIQQLINDWYDSNKVSFDKENLDSQRDNAILASLFAHLIDHAEFYDVLYQQNLLHFIIPSLKIILKPHSATGNFSTYLESFLIHGIYGWILEWFHRGKVESAQDMEVLLRNSELV